MKHALIAVVLLVATAGTAAAQDTGRRRRTPLPPPPASDDVTDIEFRDADLVGGTSQVPWLDPIMIRLPGERESLIRLRTTFAPEMLKSVEDL